MSEFDGDPFPVTMPFPVTAPEARYSSKRCDSLRELERSIDDLRPRDDRHLLVFRGQTREYHSEGVASLIPATRRPGYRVNPFKLRLKGYSRFMVERQYASLDSYSLRLREAALLGLPEPDPPRVPWADAYSMLVQHYCSGTNGIDITFDRDIALWFACHHAKRMASGITHRPVTSREIDHGLVPVIYVIECLAPRWGRRLPGADATIWFAPDLSDLRELMPEPYVRPNRQQSGTLLASAVNGSHANAALSFVLARFELSARCVAQALALKKHSESYLFPSPRKDYLYAWLLSSKSERRVYRLARHKQYTAELCAEILRSNEQARARHARASRRGSAV